jgi:predicted amidophosphoribosyltransferase
VTGLPDVPEPAGFGKCPECAYRGTGTAAICFECASRTIEPLAEKHCLICDGKLNLDATCGNPLCNQAPDARGWDCIYAISMRSGVLKGVISDYKYNARKGWAWIFGRVLVGYLEQVGLQDDYGLIVPMPTFIGPGGRDWDHIDLIVKRAAIEGPDWPFQREVITKTAATPKLVDQRGFRARAEVAEQKIAPALDVIDPSAVAGRDVLVVDDVFTSGLTLREVAKKLKRAGAKSVGGIVLARQPFRS